MKNIVLCCAAGMSTSMLVQKMKDAAQKKGVDVTIKAVPVAEFEENIATADIVLLGPQVKYEQAKLQALADPLGKSRRYRYDGLRHDERRCGTGQSAETTGVMAWKS